MSLYVPPRSAEPAKAGPVGPGAGVLMTEYLMPMMLPTDPQRKMRMALKLGHEVSWIRAAERVISGKIGGDPDLQGAVQWHLEDPDGETINADYEGDARAIEAYKLIATPVAELQQPDDKQITVAETQGQLWEVTSRHMGLAGQGYWFLDGLDTFGIPKGILYVRPDRIWPDCDDQGNLVRWVLDPKYVSQKMSGTILDLREVIQFPLETPSEGFLAVGLVESAVLKGQLSQAIDRHLGSMVSSGGRLSGMFAPKGGSIDDDGTWDQLVRDMRNLSEQPDAAKRVQLMRGPMEYTRTQATLQEMAIIDLMSKNRDDLLALWGVPLSQVGGSSPAGLNSGDIRKFDEAALWQNAIVMRLVPMKQRIQGRILDRWKPLLGWAPKLVLTIPEFDDDSPRYDKVQKSQVIALRNSERRGLLGFEPFGDDIIGPSGGKLDDEIWMPATMPGPTAVAPEAGQGAGVVIVAGGAGGPTNTPSATGSQSGAAPTSGIPTQGPEKPSMGGNLTAMGAGMPAGGAGATLKARDDVLPAVVAQLRKQWPAGKLDLIGQGAWKFDDAVALDKVNASRRPGGRNPKVVAGTEAALDAGAPTAPAVFVKTKVLGKPGLRPVDGWHKVLAYQHAGEDTIPAYIGKGDATWTQAMVDTADGIASPAKARLPGYQQGMKDLRVRVEASVTPKLRASVSRVLDEQKRDIVTRVRTMYDAIKRKPNDHSAWFNAPRWDGALTMALQPALRTMAETVHDHVGATLRPPGKAAPAFGPFAPQGAVAHVLKRGAARVTNINETTRQGVADLILRGLDEGMGPAELGDAIEAWSGWDEYRGELIARTELMDAYNAASLGSYDELGVAMVEAIDGDGDEECAARDGQEFTLEEADSIEDHPNGTLDWLPITDWSEGKGEIVMRASTRKAMESVADLLREDAEQEERMAQLMTALSDEKARPVVVDTAPFADALRELSTTLQSLPAPIVNVPAPIVNLPGKAQTVKKVIRNEAGDIIEVREENT